MPKKDSTGVNKYENPQKIDRFTSNGYGVKLAPLTAEQKKGIAQLNKELSGKAPVKKPAPKKK